MQEFLDEVLPNLTNLIGHFFYLVNIEGILLDGLDELVLGPVTICKASVEVLSKIEFRGNLSLDSVQDNFPSRHWLIGKTFGSPDISRRRFEHTSKLSVGILAIYASILAKGAIHKGHLRAVLSPFQQGSSHSILRWENEGKKPNLSRSWSGESKLAIDPSSLSYLRDECFYDTFGDLLVKSDQSELEVGILRALFWFADAHGDQNTTMRFIKLWSCVECFFSLSSEKITEANAQGIATILTFGGYGVGKPDGYKAMKKRVKALYDLRSRALHRAEIDIVDTEDLVDLSYWTAWLIVSIAAFTYRGYKHLEELRVQTERLDRLASSS